MQIIKRTHLWFSLIATIILLVAVYVFDNFSYPFGESTAAFTIIETGIQNIKKKNVCKDDVVFINIGYEPELVDTPNGKEARTNRDTLAKLLKAIGGVADFCFLDIRLDADVTVPADSALVSQIRQMDNIVIAKHWDYTNGRDFPLADSSLMAKAAYCDYTASVFNTAFQRYQYIQRNGISAPLKLYMEITGHRVASHKLFYSDGWRLCRNALFISIPEDFSEPRERAWGEPKYWNLSEDFWGETAGFTRDDLIGICRGKLVVIGNFVDDVHDTYIGRQPGPYLHYLAYDSLREGRHILPWWYILLIAAVYFVTFCQIARQQRLLLLIPAVRKYKLLHFIASLTSNVLLLTIVSWLSYSLFKIPASIFVPTVAFTICDIYFRYKSYEI